jgi:hypothetical protein
MEQIISDIISDNSFKIVPLSLTPLSLLFERNRVKRLFASDNIYVKLFLGVR